MKARVVLGGLLAPALTPSSPVLAEGLVLHRPGLGVHLGVLLILHWGHRHREGPAFSPTPA